MNANMYNRIRDFLSVWDYTPDQLRDYIKQVAPDMLSSGQRAREERSREFFDQVLGRKPKPAEPTPIPKPADDVNGLARDLWLLLGIGDNALSLQDLADYEAERLARLEAKQQKEAASREMAMSDMLRNLNAKEREENMRFIAETFERSERLRNEKTDMNALFRDLPAGKDSTPHTFNIGGAPVEGDSFMNDQLRGLNADMR